MNTDFQVGLSVILADFTLFAGKLDFLQAFATRIINKTGTKIFSFMTNCFMFLQFFNGYTI